MEPPKEVEGEDGVEKSRVLVVSNRLPIGATKDHETGKWTFKMSSGGLVTALQGVRGEMDFLWIGWMGIEVDESEMVSLPRYPFWLPLLCSFLLVCSFFW